MDWQAELVEIAAPPFHERERAAGSANAFANSGLENVEIDASGNALGFLPGDSDLASPCVLLSAHIDTIFPPGPAIRAEREGHRLKAPGACDNGAGLAGLLAIAAVAAKQCGKRARRCPCTGEFFSQETSAKRVRATCAAFATSIGNRPGGSGSPPIMVLDGAGHEVAVTEALGSRRFPRHHRRPGRTFLDGCRTAKPNRPDECGHHQAGGGQAQRLAAHDLERRHHRRRHLGERHPGKRLSALRLSLHRSRAVGSPRSGTPSRRRGRRARGQPRSRQVRGAGDSADRQVGISGGSAI